MAKWGEGDARWVVQDRADGSNVNSWHWEEKSVKSAAAAKVSEMLRGVRVETVSGTIVITEVTECTGDCVVTRRKKDKTMMLYDLSLKLNWEILQPADSTSKALGGHITVHEFATGHEDFDDLQLQCSGKDKASKAPEIINAAKSLFLPIHDQLIKVSRQLEQEHCYG